MFDCRWVRYRVASTALLALLQHLASYSLQPASMCARALVLAVRVPQMYSSSLGSSDANPSSSLGSSDAIRLVLWHVVVHMLSVP